MIGVIHDTTFTPDIIYPNIQSTGVVDREFIGKSTEDMRFPFHLIWHLGGPRRLQNTLTGRGNNLSTLLCDFRSCHFLMLMLFISHIGNVLYD